MIKVNTLALESNRQIKINFDGRNLSSDAGLLLIKEFISKLGIDTLLEKAFKTSQADLVLYSYRGEPNEYHSMTAPMILLDLLIMRLTEANIRIP